jgi:hypothetical protein
MLPLYLGHSHVLANPLVYWALVAPISVLVILISTAWHRALELPFMGKKSPQQSPRSIEAAEVVHAKT